MNKPRKYDRRPSRQWLFLPALSRQRPRTHRRIGFAGSHSFNPVALSADRSFTPTCKSRLPRKPIAAAAAIQSQQARTRGEIPIAPAAPRHTLPAISCLGAFRPPATGTRGQAVIPAAENLHKLRHQATALRDNSGNCSEAIHSSMSGLASTRRCHFICG